MMVRGRMEIDYRVHVEVGNVQYATKCQAVSVSHSHQQY
jgi:hypothetical protein